jgi:Ricin-type beta-trefoil lectin domain
MPVMIGSHRLGRLGRLAAAAAVAIVASLAVPAAAHAAEPTRIEFVNDGSGKCLDVRSEDGSYTLGARIQQYKCKYPDGNQYWDLTPAGNGYYNVFNVQSGLCLDVTGGGTADGTPTQQWYCNNTPNQQWNLDYQGEFVRLISANSGKCLDVRKGSHDDHAIVQQWTCNGTAAQRWSEVYQIIFH